MQQVSYAVWMPEVVDRMWQRKQEPAFIQHPSVFSVLRVSSNCFMGGVRRTGTLLPLFPTMVIQIKYLQSFCSSGVRAKLTSSCVSDVSLDKYADKDILDTSPALLRLKRITCTRVTLARSFQFEDETSSFRAFKYSCCFSDKLEWRFRPSCVNGRSGGAFHLAWSSWVRTWLAMLNFHLSWYSSAKSPATSILHT